MDKYRTTISDIAEELGVSTATVSNVIHGKTAKISAATVRRVNELLEKRNYMPNMAEILLGQNSSKIVGIVINNHEKYENRTIEDGFISSTLNALSREIDKAGFFVMVKVTSELDTVEKFASMWNMVGLVIMGFCDTAYKNLREKIRIPFVIVDGETDSATSGICNLILDNYDGGRQVGKYLAEAGHSRVLCITDNLYRLDSDRINGAKGAFGSDKTDILVVPTQKDARHEYYAARLNTFKSYSAIFAVSDYYAMELIRFLADNNINVPQDISVIGFDDAPLSEFCTPPLTTVRQNIAERARKAIELLSDLTNGKSVPPEFVSPVTLIIRDSVKRLK